MYFAIIKNNIKITFMIVSNSVHVHNICTIKHFNWLPLSALFLLHGCSGHIGSLVVDFAGGGAVEHACTC